MAQEQQGRKIETRTAVERIAGFTIVTTAVAVLAVLVAAVRLRAGQVLSEIAWRNRALRLQGIRGLVCRLFRPDRHVLKAIVANPAMINAYKAGVPGNGQPFPEGSMIVKLQSKPKKSTEALFAVHVPSVFKQAFGTEKDSKRFPKTGGWDTRCSTTMLHRTSSRPMRKASQTADTRAMWLCRRGTTYSTRTRSPELRLPLR